MRVSPFKKLFLALAAALAMVLTLAGAPASATEGELSGSITIRTSPDPTVIEIPGDEEGPCAEVGGNTFDAETDSGVVTVDLSGTSVFEKPGSPGSYDLLTFGVLFQNLSYSQTTAGPPSWVYAIEGQVALQIDVQNLNTTTCEVDPEGKQCSLGVILEVDGTLTQGSALDPIDAGATANLVATSDDPNGLEVTLLGGDCGAYSSIIGRHVDIDLDVQF